jgi:hypothetical protein
LPLSDREGGFFSVKLPSLSERGRGEVVNYTSKIAYSYQIFIKTKPLFTKPFHHVVFFSKFVILEKVLALSFTH